MANLNGSFSTDTLLASGTRTTSANVAAVGGYGGANTLIVQLACTAASGTTPTLDVVIQDTVDGGTNYRTIITFTQLITTGVEQKTYALPFSDTLRVSYTIGAVANPSFTFSVKCFAKV